MDNTLIEQKPISEIKDDLLYISYASQRDLGMTHEGTLRIGLGKPEYLVRYELEKEISNLKK